MTSPDDLTPPSPEPLPAHRKQLMRDELLTAAQGGSRRPERRWLMPGLAAAAVLAIVAGVAVAGQRGDHDPSGLPGPLTPAGGGGSAISGQPHHQSAHRDHATPGQPHPGHSVPSSPHVIRRGQQIIHGPGPLDDQPATTCAEEIANLDDSALQGATMTAQHSYGDYTTSLYESASAWIVCDDFATGDGGPPTLMQQHSKTGPYQPGLETLGISENVLARGGSQYLAAGRAFDGVQSISYAFPDGHTEDAVVDADGFWSMAYLPTSGPLNDSSVNETTLDPIQVTVDYTDGHSDSFTLQWGLNTCAQLNHGC